MTSQNSLAAALDQVNDRVRAAAPQLVALLLRLEDSHYASALPCPFCLAPEEGREDGLAHEIDCALDRVLFETGARRLRGAGGE